MMFFYILFTGIMRKCLYGWINSNFNNKNKTKLSGKQINILSDKLEECNIRKPKEIDRAIRRLDCIKYWKGSEYRTFLLYLGPVVLKDTLNNETYHHFLTLFCAVTLVSCEKYMKHIQVADQLFKDYVQQFILLYGRDSISSNVHNLIHVINDVKKFGILPKISSYPFENFLGYLKSLLRKGNKPLPQIAKRILELNHLNNIPFSQHSPTNSSDRIIFDENFVLSTI